MLNNHQTEDVKERRKGKRYSNRKSAFSSLKWPNSREGENQSTVWNTWKLNVFFFSSIHATTKTTSTNDKLKKKRKTRKNNGPKPFTTTFTSVVCDIRWRPATETEKKPIKTNKAWNVFFSTVCFKEEVHHMRKVREKGKNWIQTYSQINNSRTKWPVNTIIHYWKLKTMHCATSVKLALQTTLLHNQP